MFDWHTWITKALQKRFKKETNLIYHSKLCVPFFLTIVGLKAFYYTKLSNVTSAIVDASVAICLSCLLVPVDYASWILIPVIP